VFVIETSVPRIVIAGTGSGCGKTTVTCALLEAFRDKKIALRSFKCGPDYIDPMFHKKILGIPSRNLDSFLCGEETTRYLFAKNCPPHITAVIEGVMGYYDGISGISTSASTHHISHLLETPVVLVASCKGKSLSLAAELKGYREFLPNRIAGVILNCVKKENFDMYKEAIETTTGLPVFGFLPYIPEASLESRHLGLVTADEIKGFRDKIRLLAEQAQKSIDLARLLAIAGTAGVLSCNEPKIERMPITLPIGIAEDAAFCFYYQDSLDLLKSMGAKLIPFSPISDKALPPGICGLILGGGYPELYAKLLCDNVAMLDDIANKVGGGLPTLAECGGFMLLCREIVNNKNEAFPMAGVLHSTVRMTGLLSRFGYVTLTAKKDNLLCKAGEQIPAHEFHYSKATFHGKDVIAQKSNGKNWNCIHATATFWAGYPHLHFWGNTSFARRYLEKCALYRGKQLCR